MKKTKNFNTLCSLYRDTLNLAKTLESKIGDILVNQLKEVIPDIKYQLGDYDLSWSVICFKSDELEKRLEEHSETLSDKYPYTLEEIIENEFPQLRHYINSFIWLTDSEATLIRTKLKKLKGGEVV